MNQQIQVFDGFEYVHENQALKIIASAAGQLITCYIFGVAKSKAQQFYADHQFDIEEAIVEQIEHESWNESGEIHIQHSVI